MAVLRGGGFTIFVEYDTKFTKGDGLEQLAWRFRGDTALLVAYEIQSPALSRNVK
jgi:hypothetical protein